VIETEPNKADGASEVAESFIDPFSPFPILAIRCYSNKVLDLYMWNITGLSLMKDLSIDELREERHRALSALIPIWRRPGSVKVEGNNLVYSARTVRTYLNTDKPYEPLQSFLALDGAVDSRIASFARRWGVLGICEHGLPASHNSGFYTFPDTPGWTLYEQDEFREHCNPLGRKSGDWYEPLAEWNFWIRQASIIVRLGADLHGSRPGRTDDWNAMGYKPEGYKHFTARGQSVKLIAEPRVPSLPPPVPIGRMLLAQYINDWLAITGVRPFFFWEDGEHGFCLLSEGIDTLLATLSVQILLLINKASGYAFCSNCGRPFLLRHRQSAARNIYCDSTNCGTAASRRAAQKQYRLREQQDPSREKRQIKITRDEKQTIRRLCNTYEEYPPNFIKNLAKKYEVDISYIYRILRDDRDSDAE
jgi:hypothetical protein